MPIDSESKLTPYPEKTPSTRRTVLYLQGWNVPALHEGIVDYAKEAGWTLDNGMCYSSIIPSESKPDGVICRHAFQPDIIDFARELGVPTVAFEHAPNFPVPRVYYDDESIGAMAARHLLERGFRTLGFVHLRHTPQQQPRMTGFRREVEAAGATFVEMAPPMAPIRWNPGPGPSWDWLQDALAPFDAPVGLMGSNDQIARTLIDALVNFGYHVPAQIAVIGAENDPMICEIAAVPISSVDSGTRRLGYEAARLLDRMMDGEAVEPVTRIAPGFVKTRASSDIQAISNHHVAEALHSIWRNFTKPIRIDDIAASVPITRRRLQTIFHEHVGRTLHQELARVRTARACHLLKETPLKICDIVGLCGFNSSLHLHRTFQSVLGMGPKEFKDSGNISDMGVLPSNAETPLLD
jgi:LacI family transcriptional regulator